jgi:hypothetical protein
MADSRQLFHINDTAAQARDAIIYRLIFLAFPADL